MADHLLLREAAGGHLHAVDMTDSGLTRARAVLGDFAVLHYSPCVECGKVLLREALEPREWIASHMLTRIRYSLH